jgi:DNA-binding NtrC family response regulator
MMDGYPFLPAIIVLDDMDRLVILNRHLTALLGDTYVIVLTHDPETVLHHVEMREVPIVLVNHKTWGTSDLDGLQLVRELKLRAPDTIVIFSTAEHTPELEADAYAAKVDVYLIKPFPIARFEMIIHDGIAQYIQRRAARGEPHRIWAAGAPVTSEAAALSSPATSSHIQSELESKISSINLKIYGLASALTRAARSGVPPSSRWLMRLTSLEAEYRELVLMMRTIASQRKS